MLGISWTFISAMLLAGSFVTPITQQDDEYRTAEVALQSVFGLNNTDQSDAIKLLDKVEKVIGNIKSVFEGKSMARPSNDDAKLERFTDFILSLAKRLKKYDDKDLEYFVTIFNDEIRKYNYQGCKFHELLENFNLRRFLSNMLNNFRNQSGAGIKIGLEVIENKIEDDKFNKNEKQLVDFINSVYRQDSVEKFRTFLTQIDNYKLDTDKTDLDLVKMIKEGVRSIIFDYYSQLNKNARNALKHQVYDFWNSLSQNELFQSESSRVEGFRNKIKKKNKLIGTQIFNAKPDLKNAIMKSEAKKQSIYILNSIKLPKQDKIIVGSFRSDVNISQRTPPDKNPKQDHISGLQTISPLIFTTKLLKTRRKVLTFKTLYPDLVPEWTSVTQAPSRRYMSYRSPVRHHNAEKRKLFRKRGRGKKSDALAKVNGASSLVPRTKTNSLKFRHKVPVKKIDLHSRKPMRQSTKYKINQQKRMRPFRINKGLRTSKRRRIGIRGYSLFTKIQKNYRRSNIKDSMVSEEGLSIDMPEVHQNEFRRSDLNFTHHEPGLHQAQLTQSTPVVNNDIHNTTIISRDINNELSHEKEKFIRSKEEHHDFNVDSLNKVQIRFQNESTVEYKNLTDKIINKAFEINTQLKNEEGTHKILNGEKYKTVNSNEQTDNFDVQNKQDGSPVFNFRAQNSGNETEIESKMNDQNKNTFTSGLKTYSKVDELGIKDDIRQTVNEIQPNKDIEVKTVKTDNDFKTFIEDYGNDLREHESKRYKVTTKNNGLTVRPELGNNIEKYINTRTTPLTTLSSITTTAVTESPTTASPTVVTIEPQPTGFSTIPSDHNDKTTMMSLFDANFIKHLMKSKTQRTTTQNSAVGRYFNHDGVIMDSIEKLKEEVSEDANLNYDG